MRIPLAILTLVGALMLSALSLAAENYSAVTTADPTVPVDHLDLLLDPLTKEELLAEAEAWRDLVKAKVTAISTEEINTRKTGSGKPTAVLTQEQKSQTQVGRESSLQLLAQMREEKTALLDRLEIVLDAYKIKGGDAGDLEKYAEAVSGIKVEVTDTSATWSAVRSWVLSKEGGIKWFARALQLLMIMLIFWIIAKAFGSLVRKATDRSKRMSGLLKSFLNKFVERTILFIGLMVALSTLGVEVGALLALVGGGAFILGFALQDTLGNFAAGVMLLIYRPFDVGDAVEVGGVSGLVDNVSLVNTTIRTFDNKLVLVPNKQVWGQVITNSTASHQRRVDMTFGISYSDDVEQAKTLIEKVVKEHEMVLLDPVPVVELHKLGESSVDFVCRPWTRTENYWRVYWDITKKVKQAFADAGISIPFPQRDVHVYHIQQTANSGESGAPRGKSDGFTSALLDRPVDTGGD